MKFSTTIFSSVLAAAAALFAAGPAFAQTTKTQQSEQILQPSGETAEHDSFGVATAISGNGKTMIIGGFNGDGNQVGAGAAYIFDRIGNTWVQTAKLFAADGHATPLPSPPFAPGQFESDSFGLTVAIDSDGDTVAVGAPMHNHTGQIKDAGAVYVFQRVNGVWSQQAELFSPHPTGNVHFGSAPDFGGLGIGGNTIVVTDQGNGGGNGVGLPGAVDVFTRTNGVWTFTTQLFVPDDPFLLPSSLAFDGRTLVVGSDTSDAPSASFAGVVYVFQLSAGGWSAPVALTAGDAASNALFGFSVGVDGNRIVVGATSAPGATAQSGAAYVFAREEGVWSQKAKLSAGDGLDRDQFGDFVAVDGPTVLVGAQQHTPPGGGFGAGAAYVFRPQDDGTWRQIVELSASDGIAGGNFGDGVAVRNNTLVAGAFAQHPPVEGYPGGEAYVYRLEGQ